jgi:hypothetical protein
MQNYKAIKNFSNQNVTISEGEILSEETLIEKFKGEGVFNYMMTCTDLQFCIEKIESSEAEEAKKQAEAAAAAEEAKKQAEAAAAAEEAKKQAEAAAAAELKAGDEIIVESNGKEETVILDEEQAKTLNEQISTEAPKMIVLVNANLKDKDKNFIAKKGDKIEFSKLVEVFGIEEAKSFFEAKKIMEIKITPENV